MHQMLCDVQVELPFLQYIQKWESWKYVILVSLLGASLTKLRTLLNPSALIKRIIHYHYFSR